MKNTYIALDITPDASTLVLRAIVPTCVNVMTRCVPLSGAQKQGMIECSTLLGAMLITGLSDFHFALDRYALLSKMTSPMPFPLNYDNRTEMRAQRMGVGLGADATGPALLVRAYDCDQPIGEDHLQSLKQLAELGKSVAPFVIGEIMLRKLAATHPDVLPLFPKMAL